MTTRPWTTISAPLILAGVAMAFFTTCALAREGPRLVKGEAPECREALNIAEAVYRSNVPHLYGPPIIPPTIKSRLVLGFNSRDLSGSDSLVVDDKVLDKLPNSDQDVGSTYVQKTGQGGYRLAVREDGRGWRGDAYTVFSLPDEKSLAEATALASSSQRQFETLASGQWLPPLVFQRQSSERLWFMILGQPYEVRRSWSVYAVADDGLQPLCSVEFLPRGNGVPLSLLPQAVREFERLLNRTMGSGADEGTLQSTAGIRIDVQHTWGNVALRPWALGQPYNIRETVDAGLTTWAEASAGNRHLLQDIHRQYPLAETALARYYQQHFGLSRANAQKSAAYAMDIALRMHYVFHEESDRRAENRINLQNPWLPRP